jgi:hypothetical protein
MVKKTKQFTKKYDLVFVLARQSERFLANFYLKCVFKFKTEIY